MDAQRFDAWARALARSATRRRVLGGLLGTVVGALAGTLLPRRHRGALAGTFCGDACGDEIFGSCDFATDGCTSCCNDRCVNASTDPSNCGFCGNVCPVGQSSCVDGVCLNTGPGEDPCLFIACPDGATCVNGDCILPCPDGWIDCGGYCADLVNDPDNCQACGNVCPVGYGCCPGAGCVDFAFDPAFCGDCFNPCPNGWTCCDDCRDTDNDPANCGACDFACGGNERCEAASCVPVCPPGQLACAGDCVDPGSDPGNCGGCDVRCAGGENCEDGECVPPVTPSPSCPEDRAQCAEGCLDVRSDPNNCGDCGVRCADREDCQGGACVQGCPDGGTPCDGICVDLARDRTNCGTCGNACDGQTRCQNGRCVRPDCPGEQERCAGGCTDLKTNPAHCGACNARCDAGACCDGRCVDLQADEANCSQCGFACPPEFTCEDGACVLRKIETGMIGDRWSASPSLCLVEPRPAAALRDLIQQPPPVTQPDRSWQQIAKGATVDFAPALHALRQAITNAVVERSACANAGDPLRETALMTDALARSVLLGQGWTPDALDELDGQTVTPPPSNGWEVIAGIDDVVDLRRDRAAAVVTYEPRAADLPPARDVQVFVKDGERWLLDQVVPVDGPTGAAVRLHIFDCPPGVATGETATCEPATELRYDYQLVAGDGAVLGLAKARLVGTGQLEWPNLPPRKYALKITVPEIPGASVVVAGARKIGPDLYQLPQHVPLPIAYVYHPRNLLTDTLLFLDRKRQYDKAAVACPPCSVRDWDAGICAYTCPPCSICRTVPGPDGTVVSDCQPLCEIPKACLDGRCCLPFAGELCMVDADCCGGTCVGGECSCHTEGQYCGDASDCCGDPGRVGCVDRRCRACTRQGGACARDGDCCQGVCFDRTCRCCSGDCAAGNFADGDPDYDSAGKLCCLYPQTALCVPDGPWGKGFVRCCTLGVDCIGDPAGPVSDPHMAEAGASICTV